MVRERGYPGAPDHFRSVVAGLRPRPAPEAYLRLKTLPGAQGQVDWAYFGKLTIGRAQHWLMAFVMVLSWSRMIFLKFYLNQRLANLMRGHEAAFAFFGGIPRVLLYDNPRNVVLERMGDAIRFHPTLLSFAGHYRYEPRPVAVARGNEKGRVERAIRYVRTAFFAARPFRDLDDLNRQALEWCLGLAADRPCPEDQSVSVRQAFASERPKLMALSENPFPTEEREEVRARKTPYVRFDGNDYSVPHQKVGRQLVILASPEQVRVLDGNEVIATHRRSYDKAEQVELPAHVEELVKAKRHAREHRGLDLLSRQVDNASELLEVVACRGGNLGNVTARLLRYVDEYGACAVQRAIREALERGTPHPQAVRFLLERERQARGRPVPLAIPVSDDPRVLDLSVRPHSLHDYDQLEEMNTDEHDQPKTRDGK
jgi:transposase